MLNAFTARVASWINSDPDNDFGIRSLKAKIDFLAEILYHEYVPTKAGLHGEFRLRLAQWIESAPDDDQKKLMYMLLEYLFFVGEKEFEAMYLTVYSRNIAQWVLAEEGISLADNNAENLLRAAVRNTLPTAITDSFNIGEFLRINNINGVNVRFTWEQAFKTNWDAKNFEKMVLKNNNRIVLLEDFVGSGNQMARAVIESCQLPSAPRVLLCPLIICPEGAKLARELENLHQNLTFSPVLELERSDCIAPLQGAHEPALFSEIRDLAKALHPYVEGKNQWTQNYGPFGFEDTGALVVTHINCPDNTLPLIHHKSDAPWNPLFVRISRETI